MSTREAARSALKRCYWKAEYDKLKEDYEQHKQNAHA